MMLPSRLVLKKRFTLNLSLSVSLSLSLSLGYEVSFFPLFFSLNCRQLIFSSLFLVENNGTFWLMRSSYINSSGLHSLAWSFVHDRWHLPEVFIFYLRYFDKSFSLGWKRSINWQTGYRKFSFAFTHSQVTYVTYVHMCGFENVIWNFICAKWWKNCPSILLPRILFIRSCTFFLQLSAVLCFFFIRLVSLNDATQASERERERCKRKKNIRHFY